MSSTSELASRLYNAIVMHGRRPRPPNTIYVTEAVSCLRRGFFNIVWNADPAVSNPRAILGKLIHIALPEVLREAFRGAEFEVECLYPLTDEWVLAGRADMVYNGEVYEFKLTSMHNRAMPLYYMQANCYAVMLGLPRFHVVIIDGGKMRVEVVSGEASKPDFERVVGRARELVAAVESGKPPPGPELDWLCENCPYKPVCYGEYVLKKEEREVSESG